MYRKRLGVSLKFISIFLAANLLLFIGLVSAHHHNHDQEDDQDSSGQCSICFVAQSVASADQPFPTIIVLQQGFDAFSIFYFTVFFEIEKFVWLQHPVVHGPPSA
jgi:hypothetical protein